jgi:menaquinone-9 beta-reductase
MPNHFNALIIGAGPAGSAAAILLARAGWSVALVERQRFPRRKVCGECIAASNLPLLEALGIGPAFDSAAGPELHRVALMIGDRQFVADLPQAAHEKFRWGRALGRETLDTLLVEQAASMGVTVLQPWSAEAMEGHAGGWRCALRSLDAGGAMTVHSQVAIAANGSWESRPSRGSGVHKRSSADLFAFKANFRNASLAAGLLPILSFQGGYGGMVVADDGATTLAGCIRRDRLSSIRRTLPGVRAGEAFEFWVRRQCAGVDDALRVALRDGRWLSAGPIDPGTRLRSSDQVFRIGNAAGEAHPIIGEGISMALQSAWLLCEQLLDDGRRVDADEASWQREAGRRYEVQWRHHFGARLRLAAAFAELAMRPALATPLLPLLSAWPQLLTAAARWAGKVRSAAESRSISALAANYAIATSSLPTSARIALE